jgi:hypothetical protein
MNNDLYKKPKEKIATDEILDMVFKDSSVKHGLQEFSKDIFKRVNAFQKEDGRFYIHCLKRDKDIFVYDRNKKVGKPEEVIRQLYLIKLTREYKYPLLARQDEENRKTYRYLNFDLLMTNPPFAGEITDSGLLRQYEFAKKNGKLKQKVERHLLFIERSLDALRPGGRMAIVLPQGIFNNTNMEWLRLWLFEKARILAVVGLEGNTFKLPAPAKGTGTKTSVLFLQKWEEDQKPLEDYPIFMAVSKKSGKDNSGDYIFVNEMGKRVKSNSGIFEAHEKLRLDDDLDEIAEEFIKFAEKEKLEWWR